MARQAGRELTVGALTALALLVLAVGVMAVGEGTHLFAGKVEYQVDFPGTDGLRIGSPIHMAGVQIGSVTSIELSPDPGATGIAVILGVADEYRARIRADSKAGLSYLQILSGEKYVELTVGDPGLPELEPGSKIQPLEAEELFKQGADIAQNLNTISASLIDILEPLQKGEGLLGKMIQDPDFGNTIVGDFSKVTGDLAAITGEIREGEGLVGRLLFDQDLATMLDDMRDSVNQMSTLMNNLAGEDSALSSLLASDGAAVQAVEDLREVSASLRRLMENLESGDTLLGKMINDPEYSGQMADDLQAVTANLRQVTGSLTDTQGTVGALLNDRQVYDGLVDITTGVNDSKFTRWLLRRYRKRGVQARDERASMAPQGTASP